MNALKACEGDNLVYFLLGDYNQNISWKVSSMQRHFSFCLAIYLHARLDAGKMALSFSH